MENTEGINFIITEEQARQIADYSNIDIDSTDDELVDMLICEALNNIIDEL